MCKKIFLFIFFLLYSVTVFADVEIIINDNAKYYADIYVISKIKADFPYPDKKDMINRKLGERSAITYGYYEIKNVIETVLLKDIPEIKKFIDKDGFILNMFVLESEYLEGDFAKVEMFFHSPLTIEEYDNFSKKSYDNIKLKIANYTNLQIKRGARKIHKLYWQTYLKTPDIRWVSEEFLAKI